MDSSHFLILHRRLGVEARMSRRRFGTTPRMMAALACVGLALPAPSTAFSVPRVSVPGNPSAPRLVTGASGHFPGLVSETFKLLVNHHVVLQASLVFCVAFERVFRRRRPAHVARKTSLYVALHDATLSVPVTRQNPKSYPILNPRVAVLIPVHRLSTLKRATTSSVRSFARLPTSKDAQD